MTSVAGVWEVPKITVDKSLSICPDGVFSVKLNNPNGVRETTISNDRPPRIVNSDKDEAVTNFHFLRLSSHGHDHVIAFGHRGKKV